MSVSVDPTTGTAATVVWEPGDDPMGRIEQAVESGRLAHALTALGLGELGDLAALSVQERVDLLRATAALTTELTRRVRHLTVVVREVDDMTWGTIASHLTGDPHARSTARSTYQAGLRQLGRHSDQEDS